MDITPLIAKQTFRLDPVYLPTTTNPDINIDSTYSIAQFRNFQSKLSSSQI